MKLMKLFPFYWCFFPLLAQAPAVSQSTTPIAQSPDVQFNAKTDSSSKDMDALRRWLQDKRLVTMREIGGDLSLSGEVRTEFQAASEYDDGKQMRAPINPKGRPMFAWDVEVNLMLDYRTDRTWAAIKLEFDNDMGQRSGTVNRIKLEKAYLGGRVIPGSTFFFDAEIGRRYLFNVFDSKIEFASMFDGVLFRFNKAFPSVGDMYLNMASFIIDDKTKHYGVVAELGALRIANIGLNMKYSLIDWYGIGDQNESDLSGALNELADLRYRFLVSQFLTSYQFFPEWIGRRIVKFYAAALVNHLALDDPLERVYSKMNPRPNVGNQAFGKKNWGWYAGVSIGMVKKKYDWAVDANFQWVQAQAVPSFDILGIGRGNSQGLGVYTVSDSGSGGPTTKATATGNGNYYGFEVDGLYALTDNLTIQSDVKMSWTLDPYHQQTQSGLGDDFIYKQAEVEFIYAF